MTDVKKKFHVIEEITFGRSSPLYHIKKTVDTRQLAHKFQERYQAIANLEKIKDKAVLYLVSHTLHHRVN